MEKNELNELAKICFTEYPEVVSVSQMQTMLGISRHAAYDLVSSGQIPAIKIGNSLRIMKLNIISFMTKTAATVTA